MKRTLTVGVDSGMIMVADSKYIDDTGIRKGSGSLLELSNGNYRVLVGSGKEQPAERLLTVVSGCVEVSDPCYILGETQEQWEKWLEKTDYGAQMDDSSFCLHCDDGGYKLTFEFIKEA